MLLAAVVLAAVLPIAPAAGQQEQTDADRGRDEVVTLRTATSKTFRNADGSFTTDVFTAPVHYLGPEGRWREIDSAVVESDAPGYAWENGANAFRTHFKDRVADDYLRFTVAGQAFTLSLEGAAAHSPSASGRPAAAPDPATPSPSATPEEVPAEEPSPSPEASPSPDASRSPDPSPPPSDAPADETASPKSTEPAAEPSGGSARDEHARAGRGRVAYDDVFDGVDLRYDLTPTGVKETLVLESAGARSSYRFRITPPDGADVDAVEQPDGSWALTMDPFADPILHLGAPYAIDASRALPDEPNASLDVRRAGRDLVLDLSVDRDWLQDPDRQFPVSLDPTMTIQPDSEDASFSANCSLCTPVTYDRVYAGTSDTSAWRGALQFNLAGVPADAVVTDASLGLYYDRYCISSSTMCWNVTQQLDVHRMTKAWTTSTQTGQLGFDPAVAASYTLDGTRSAHWMGWNLTTVVKSWLAGANPNYGILLKRSTEPLAAGGPVPPGRRYAEPSITPRLTVTYTSDAVDLEVPATLHSDGADLSWTRYTGPSGGAFVKYEVHRSKTAAFTPSESTLLATIRDQSVTTYRDTTAAPSATFTYKIVANSSASNPQTVTLPSDGNASKLLQPGPADGKQTYAYYSTQLTNCANYGADAKMWVGATSTRIMRPLLEFDVRDIPSSATITSAKLSMWHTSSVPSALTVNAHRVTSSWREGTGLTQCTGDGATWYDREGSVKWLNQGGDFASTAEGSVSNPAGEAAGWDEFDVTPMVQKWVGGQAPNLGVLFKLSDETLADGRDFSYYSDDFATTPTLRPKLAISYSDGSHADGPVVSVSSPAAGAKVSGKTVALAAAATDDRRVENVEFFVDGSRIGSDTTAPFEITWDSTLVANGAHSVTVKATDDAGNVTTSPATSVTVENSAPPTAAVTAPAGGTTQKGVVAVTANATDDLGVARVEFYFDDFRFAEDAVAPYTASWNTLDAAQPAYDGSHVLTARAYDSHGQVTTSAPVTVTVANAAGTKYLAGWSSTAVPQAMSYDPAAATQQTHGVDVTITNNSAVTWNAADVVLRYRWMRADGTVASTSADIPLGSNVMKGKSATIRTAVAPPVIGDGIDKAQYVLRFDLFDKPTATYFAAKGNKPLENPVVVNKFIKATALGLERFYHYEGEELGAGMGHLTNVASGNSLVRWTPFSSPGRGLSTVADITYNSLEDRSESPIGNNFSLSVSGLTRFGLPLDVHPNKADEISGRSNKWIEFTDGDGTTHRFNGKAAADGSTYWEEPPGVHLYLREFSTTDLTKKWALTRPDRLTYFFDSEGYPTGVEDKNGNRISYTLETTPPGEDPGGPKKRITKITDAAGQGATPAPNRSFTIDYYSKAEAKKAHVRGRIQSIADHSGSVLAFDYYDDGNLLRMTQKGGTTADGVPLADRSFVFTYTTSDGSAAAISDAAARANPDPKTNQSTRLFSVRDPRGAETTFTYYGPTSGQLRWKLKSRTNRNGQTTSFGYDITNQVTTATAPLNRIASYRYDTEGKVTSITNPKNETTQIVWSADRHVTKVTEPTGAFKEYAYNANGYMTDMWDELRNRTTLSFENLPVDTKDVTGKWKTGRTIPHVSQLRTKTNPRGTATASPVDDYQWTFDYDGRGNLLKVTEPEGSPRFATVYSYNGDGTVATVTDANGFLTTINSYDANGLPTKVTDAESQVTQFGYDDDGLLRWVQDPNHASYSGGDPRTYRSYFDYDSFHRLGRQSAPKLTAGNEPLVWSAAEYDPNDNVVTQHTPAYGHDFVKGFKTSTTYDAMDRQRTSTNPEGHTREWVYDGAGRLVQIVSPKGYVSAGNDKDYALFVAYDDLDRVVRQTRYDTSTATPKALNTHFCYDLAGDLVSVTAPKAAVDSVSCAAPPAFTTKYTYDAAHRTRTATDPLGHKRSVTYDANGNVETQTDPENVVTTSFYDQRDLLVRQQTPFTATRTLVSRLEHDGVGNVVRRISPRAHDSGLASLVSVLTYDRVNRLVKIALPYKGTETPAFMHRDYDDNGNLTRTTLADSAATLGGVPADKVTEVSYFDTGWIKTSWDNVNPKVTYDYIALGKQASRTPEGDETELWTYYDDGMVREHKDRAGHPVGYFYDENDNLTKAIDRTGLFASGSKPVDIRVAYDTLDQIEKIRHRKEGDSSTDFKFATFRYDLNGNMTERADDGVETETGTQVTGPKRHTFSFDEADWLTTQHDYLKDGCQRVNNTFMPTGREATRVVRKSSAGCDDPSAVFEARQSTEWAYFLNGKLKKLTTRKGDLASPIVEQHDIDYLQDGAYVNGHRTTDVFFRSSPATGAPCTSSAAPCTATYTYDGRDRLVREHKGHGTAADYKLDSVGNIEQKTTGASSLFYSYRGNQLQTVASGSSANVGARYFYDPVGNVDCITNGGYSGSSCSGTSSSNLVKDYAYDPLERLISVTGYSGGSKTDTAEYTYDALDRVVSQTESHGIGSVSPTTRTTKFSHLGLSTLVTREDMTGDSKSASKTYAYDAYGHRISMTDDPKDQTKPDETFTYAYDVHGSVSMLLDKAGTVKASYGYDAYGEKDNALTSEGAGYEDKDPLNAYRYTAKRFDSGSGTIDMGARRFAPDPGRFLQDDAYRGALSNLALTTDPLTQNRYSLAAGNPVSFVEVDGHMVMADGGGGGSTTPSFQEADASASTGTGSSQLYSSTLGTMGPYDADFDSVDFSWGSATLSAAMGLHTSGEKLGSNATKAGQGLASSTTSPAAKSKAGSLLAKYRWNPRMAEVGQTFRSPWARVGGKAVGAAGIGLSVYGNFNEEGNDTSDKIVESGVEIGVGLAAGAATAAVCAATALVGCLAAGAAIGIASGFAGSALGEAASAGVDWASERIGEGISAAGDAIGSGIESAGEFIGGLFD